MSFIGMGVQKWTAIRLSDQHLNNGHSNTRQVVFFFSTHSFMICLPEVMCSGKCCDELHGVWRKTSDNPVSTTNKYKVFTDHQTIGTLGLKKLTVVNNRYNRVDNIYYIVKNALSGVNCDRQ